MSKCPDRHNGTTLAQVNYVANTVMDKGETPETPRTESEAVTSELQVDDVIRGLMEPPAWMKDMGTDDLLASNDLDDLDLDIFVERKVGQAKEGTSDPSKN